MNTPDTFIIDRLSSLTWELAWENDWDKLEFLYNTFALDSIDVLPAKYGYWLLSRWDLMAIFSLADNTIVRIPYEYRNDQSDSIDDGQYFGAKLRISRTPVWEDDLLFVSMWWKQNETGDMIGCDSIWVLEWSVYTAIHSLPDNCTLYQAISIMRGRDEQVMMPPISADVRRILGVDDSLCDVRIYH